MQMVGAHLKDKSMIIQTFKVRNLHNFFSNGLSSENFSTGMVSVGLVQLWQTNIFLSLALPRPAVQKSVANLKHVAI